ncbi:MAG: sensor histidine kinase [Candidatus Korobacteraceae bacterium]
MDRVLAINLLIKLGVAAAVAAVLVRSVTFKKLLFTEASTFSQRVQLVLFIGIPFALGVVVRQTTPNFVAADLSFEASVLLGVMAGPLAGVFAGLLLAIPATLHGELLTLPFNVLAGLMAGVLRELASDREEIWGFSPFVDLSIYRWVRRNLPRPKMDWQISFFVVILVLRFLQGALQRSFPGQIFGLTGPGWGMVASYATTVMAVGTPLKIWNNTRMERKLVEQQRMLLQARMEALQNQINPHFLFNTLNSVSSLVRFDPDMARDVIVKLANILRRLLRQSDAFVPLREEVRFIDDYLDIEVVRFGRDKLRVVKELDPASLEIFVPSMLLQPLVENSLKHGLSPKIEGGTIHLRSRLVDDNLVVEVEDDGVGMAAASLLEPPTGMGGSGIGIANVAERLKVLYGQRASLTISGGAHEGTLVCLRLPTLDEEFHASFQQARASTSR